MTGTLTPLHSAFLHTVRGAVAGDPRFAALLVGGSYVHGGMDAQSDLDLVLLVEDHAYDATIGDRNAFAGRLGPLLSAFTGEHVGEPRLLICLYGPPLLHVDLKFVRLSDFDAGVERPAILFARAPDAIGARIDAARIAWPDRDADWFETRVWIWLHYGATKYARGEYHEALGMLAFLREQVLGPMLHRRAGRPQRGARRIEAFGLDPDGQLAATVAGHDAPAIAGALRAAAALYLDLRGDDPPPAPVPHMPDAVLAMLHG